MKQFLIQSEHGIPLHDFGFQMIEACRYKNWFNDSSDYTYLLTDNFTFITKASEEVSNFIPIGSIKFVHNFLKQYHNISELKPINIPKELRFDKYLKRECWFNNTKEFIVKIYNGEKLPVKKFIKSSQKVKHFTEITDDLSIVPDGRYFFSELINIESEWRCFIYNKRLVGLQNYSGDFTLFPDLSIIYNSIYDYKDCPWAYTLDVGINKEDGTFIIEIHNFYSVGLYGFADNRILPDMFEKSFKWIIEKYKEL